MIPVIEVKIPHIDWYPSIHTTNDHNHQCNIPSNRLVPIYRFHTYIPTHYEVLQNGRVGGDELVAMETEYIKLECSGITIVRRELWL